MNPTPGANLFGNSADMAVSGTAGGGSGPVPFKVQYYHWGSNGSMTWADIAGGGATWSQTGSDFVGHNRWHFRTLKSSGRATAGWNNTGGSNYFDMYVDNQAPNMPSAPSATAVSSSSMDLTWTLPTDRGSGTGASDGATERLPDEIDETVAANWYRAGNVGIGVRRDGSSLLGWFAGSSCSDTGLSANTSYSYDIAARDNTAETRGTWHNVTGYTSPVAARTLIEQVAGIAVETVSANGLSVKASGTFTNLTEGSSGIKLSNTTLSTDSGWVQNTDAWANAGLTPNTEYQFSAVSRNAEGIENSPVTSSICTLAPAPTPAEITCSRPASTWFSFGTFSFTAVGGFGAGRAEYYGYAWGSSSTYSWTGSEAQWSTGTLDMLPASPGAYYLHVRSYNADDVPGGDLTLGPYLFDDMAPDAPSKLTATGYGRQITLQWINGADAHSGFDHVHIYRSETAPDGYTLQADNQSGTQWTDLVGTDNTVRYYRVATVDSAGNESASYLQVSARTSITGVNIWTYASEFPSLSAPGILRNPGLVSAGSNDHQIHGISAANGLRNWVPFTTGGAIQGRCPIAYIGATPTIFAGSQDNYVYAVNALSGALTWMADVGAGNKIQAKVGGQIGLLLTAGPKAGQIRDAIIAGTYNLGTSTGNFVRALDAIDGSTLWTFAPGNMDVVTGAPAVIPSRNMAIVSSYSAGGTGQPSLWAIDTTSGSPLWTASLGSISGSPATNQSGSRTYVGTNAGALYAYDVGTGSEIWQISLGSAIYGAPWVEGNKLYVATTNRLYCLTDAGSSAVLNSNWGNGVGYISIASPSQPVVSWSLGKLYVGSSDGNVYEISTSNGARRPYTIGSTVGDPTVDIGTFMMYFGAGDGRVYAVTVPFVRVDDATVYGLLRVGGLMPDGPFSVNQIYSVKVKVIWRGVPAGTHAQKLRFYTPEGTFYQSVNTTFSTGSSGDAVEVWGELPIAGTWAERLLGTWRVDVLLDNDTSPFKSESFVLQN